MLGLVFTLVSAILGVAMFGAILLAPSSSRAEASIASSESAGDGSPAIVASAKHRAFDIVAIDEVRVANANVNGNIGKDDVPPKPSRPATDQQPRTQVAQVVKQQQQVAWQMAAQIPTSQTMLRQMM